MGRVSLHPLFDHHLPSFQPKMKILSVLFAFCLVAVHCLPMENKNETRTLIPALELAHPTCNETTPCNDPNHFCGAKLEGLTSWFLGYRFIRRKQLDGFATVTTSVYRESVV